MKQSIEAIWKNGFLKDDALLAPTLNELYSQKSQSLVDKFERLFAINIKVILIAMVVVAIVLSTMGSYLLAVYIDALLLALILYAKSTRKHLVIDNSMSSYQYILTFYNWLNGQVERFSTFYRFFYPLLALGLMLQYRFSETGQRDINYMILQNENGMMIAGIPLTLFIVACAIIVTLWLASPAIYRWDMRLVYGKEMDKLEQLVNEMKMLSNEKA